MTTAAVPTVWVVVHDLSRSGVPVVLLRLLRAVPDARTEVHVIAARGGPLEGDLRAACASLTVLQPADRRSVVEAAALGLETAGAARASEVLGRARAARRRRALAEPDVVVAHGAGAWRLSRELAPAAPTVLHLHELDLALDRCIPRADQRRALGEARSVLAVSRPVAQLALTRGARDVELVPGVIDPDDADRHGADPLEAAAVMGAGAPGWRKGTDRLAAVAFELARRGHPGAVAWVGGRPSGPDAVAVDASDPVRWIEPLADPWRLLRHARLILVPSREDPLPLVALEAGLHRRAVVATPTGGLPELLDGGRGAVAPSHDVGWLARAAADLLRSPAHAAELGAALHEHVLATHAVGLVAPQWWRYVVDAADA